MLTQKRLNEVLLFNLDTGRVTNKIERNRSGADIGVEAGYVHHSGYRRTIIDGKDYSMARLVWLHAYGKFPEFIDHINRDRSDDRLSNLREITKAGNSQNKSMQSNNKSGITGIRWNKKGRKWEVNINVDRKQKYLGQYDLLKHAIIIRERALIKYNYSEGHGSHQSQSIIGGGMYSH